MSDWYYRIGEKVYGPYSEAELRQKIEEGIVGFHTAISRDGFTDWRITGRCPEFSSHSRFVNVVRQRQPGAMAILAGKIASLLRHLRRSPDSQAAFQTRSRKRLVFWCLGIGLAGVLACLFLMAAPGHLGRGLARRLFRKTQASDPSNYNLEKTMIYWESLREIQQTAKVSQEQKPEGNYPQDLLGQFDLAQFAHQHFEDLKEYHRKNAHTARGVIAKIEKLAVEGVDPALLRYKLEACDVWALVERANLDFAEILSDTEEQKLCFASPESYALRFGSSPETQNGMDARKLENQKKIEEKIRKWKALTEEIQEADSNLVHRRQEVKELLTSRYNWEFE